MHQWDEELDLSDKLIHTHSQYDNQSSETVGREASEQFHQQNKRNKLHLLFLSDNIIILWSSIKFSANKDYFKFEFEEFDTTVQCQTHTYSL